MHRLHIASSPPSGFLDGSLFKEFVYFGLAKRMPEGFSLRPEGGSEYGIYVTPRRRYAQNYGPVLNKALVSLKKPLIVHDKSEISAADLTRSDVDKIQRQGYDSIVSSTSGALDTAAEFVLFHPEQVWVWA